jgi:hypothetical protein
MEIFHPFVTWVFCDVGIFGCGIAGILGCVCRAPLRVVAAVLAFFRWIAAVGFCILSTPTADTCVVGRGVTVCLIWSNVARDRIPDVSKNNLSMGSFKLPFNFKAEGDCHSESNLVL